MSNRVLGIMILVGAEPVLSLSKGLPCPTRRLTPRRAQQAAPLRFRYHNDRQSSYPHHSLKSHFVEELETDKPIVVTERETGTGEVSS